MDPDTPRASFEAQSELLLAVAIEGLENYPNPVRLPESVSPAVEGGRFVGGASPRSSLPPVAYALGLWGASSALTSEGSVGLKLALYDVCGRVLDRAEQVRRDFLQSVAAAPAGGQAAPPQAEARREVLADLSGLAAVAAGAAGESDDHGAALHLALCGAIDDLLALAAPPGEEPFGAAFGPSPVGAGVAEPGAAGALIAQQDAELAAALAADRLSATPPG